MTQQTVQKYAGIHIGDTVSIRPDSGMQYNKTSYHVVSEIVLTEWDAEERRRMRAPAVEAVYGFADGGTAGMYDRIRKVNA